jgi:thiol-disulfide isomerase/thioredoxin
MTTPETPPKEQQPVTSKHSPFKVVIPILLILGVAFAALSWIKSSLLPKGPQQTTTSSAPVKGGQYPDFEVSEFQGKSKKISEIPAKVVLINFWATWCEACMVEMPSIVALRKAYAPRGLEVLAINVDEKPEAVLPPVLKKLGIDFTVYTDAEGKLADLFDVHAIPLTVVLNKDRKELFVQNGEYDWNSADFRAKMDEWLAK